METRYSRQMLFPPIGKSGQRALSCARVSLIGCGALGAAHAEALVRAGIGFLRIIDRDFVEFSNLQRQMLFSESDALNRLPKAIAAKNRLSAINSEIAIDSIVADINNSNIEAFIKDVDLVIDGSDNFQVRYLVNDACVKLKIPWIYGAAVSSYGTTMTIRPNLTPCLRCIFTDIPPVGSAPTCDTAGVIQPIISLISAIQISEALKLLTANDKNLHGKLLQIDVWENENRGIELGAPDPNCICCAKHKFSFLDSEHANSHTSLCGRNAVQVLPPNPENVDLSKLAIEVGKLTDVSINEYLLRFALDNLEVTVFSDGRAIIRGTDDPVTARSAYAKYIGI